MLAVATCYFNFPGFKRPRANLMRFLRQMKRDGAEVFGVEAHTSLQKPVTQGMKNWKQIRVNPGKQALWHKEAAINLAVRDLDPKYTAVAWVDADVWFANPEWQKDTLEALKTHDVVQMFETCHWTSPDGSIEHTKPAAARVSLTQEWRSHPGFAWAMRRELWDKTGGLYPYALSGGGDTVMTLAFQRTPLWHHAKNHVGVCRDLYDQWAANFKGVSVGYVPGALFHEWHGSMKDRDYHGRSVRVSKIDVTKDLRFASNGLLEWTEHADIQTVRQVRDYFTQKNEDSQ